MWYNLKLVKIPVFEFPDVFSHFADRIFVPTRITTQPFVINLVYNKASLIHIEFPSLFKET